MAEKKNKKKDEYIKEYEKLTGKKADIEKDTFHIMNMIRGMTYLQRFSPKKVAENSAKIYKAKSRVYNQKQKDILAMADTEFVAEIYPYLKDRPLAKLGLDSHLFDQGKLNAEEFKQKLLNITRDYHELVNLSEKGYVTTGGKIKTASYYPGLDKIELKKTAALTRKQYEPEGIIYQAFEKKGLLQTLAHELEHRGSVLLDSIIPKSYKDPQDHGAIASRDEKMMKQFGDYYSRVSSYTPKKSLEAKQDKRIKEAFEKGYVEPFIGMLSEEDKKRLSKRKLSRRYPSTGYNRGGKVYSNQPRRVRISRGR